MKCFNLTNKMKFLTTIEARFDSTRLPGKVLLPLTPTKTVLDILISRIKNSENISKIILATSKNKNNSKLVDIAKKNKILFYRGSEKNVLERLYKATKDRKEKYIIQLTADNPLIDFRVIDYVVNFFKKNLNKYDFVTNKNLFDKKKFFIPNGMIVSVFKKEKLLEAFIYQKKTNKKDLAEYPMLFFCREGRRIMKCIDLQMPKKWTILPKLRLTLDTYEDYFLIYKIYNILKEKKIFSLIDIINFIKKNLTLLKINEKIKQKKTKI